MDIVLIGHEGHQEVIGTMGQAPRSIALVETADDVDQLTYDDDANVAYITQTTLSMDETARRRHPAARAVPAAPPAQEGRHLLRDHEPAGRGQDARRAV